MQAIVRTKENAMDHYPANAEGYGTAIQLLHELATEKDNKRLNIYCEKNNYNKYLGVMIQRFTNLGVMRSEVSVCII
jgi:hypothetical protein